VKASRMIGEGSGVVSRAKTIALQGPRPNLRSQGACGVSPGEEGQREGREKK